MSRRIGYGRASTDVAAQHIVARLRVAGCTHVVVDRGAGADPRPEWDKLTRGLRAGDTLVIATLPHDQQGHERVRDQLHRLAADRAINVEVLVGARLRHRETSPQSTGRPLSAGQIGGTLSRIGAASYRTNKPANPEG
ncbi:MAG: hypothetical protein QOE76_816 [Frankiales bacterium]|jgi:hypothetical protein|nr:hypothetical protein [Frankiales bacterium]